MSLNSINEIINEFSDIIVQHSILRDEVTNKGAIFEMKIHFIDSSKLQTREIIYFLSEDSSKRNYSFQWMNEDNSLIIRWDNAKHHSFLKNFPFHRHEGADENVLDSVEMTLPDVLSFIKSRL